MACDMVITVGSLSERTQRVRHRARTFWVLLEGYMDGFVVVREERKKDFR